MDLGFITTALYELTTPHMHSVSPDKQAKLFPQLIVSFKIILFFKREEEK
jgi:hypothetical protein